LFHITLLILLASLTAAGASYPVEVVIDSSRAPDLKALAAEASEVCRKAYPMMCDELASPGYTPPRSISITIDPAYDGIAGLSASGITISADFIRGNPHDLPAALIHEMAHVVQGYGDQPVPMWLVDGIADYIRFFRWSTGELGHINPDRAHYYGSYRITASFLKYLVDHYDATIVRKLNQACREGRYRDSLFKDITGKPVRMLGAEWQATLPRTPADFAPDAQVDDEEEEGWYTLPPWLRISIVAALVCVFSAGAGWAAKWYRRRSADARGSRTSRSRH
jgi:hypothetical protein